MIAQIIRGDARNLPLADASVDLVVTSPPYWSLRSYTDGGQYYDGQIGAEPTPAAYIANLIECTREWMRVLKPAGSCFVNLGDKYSSGSGGQSNLTALGQRLGTGGGQKQDSAKQRVERVRGMPPKSLLLLPERYRIACIDELGLIVRAVMIWDKPNGLPESVTDRVRRSHEDWVHLTKAPRYFSAVDTIREAHAGEFLSSGARNARYGKPGGRLPNEAGGVPSTSTPGRWSAAVDMQPLGKLPGSVWTVATQPLKVPAELGVDHFAAFPMEWPRRIIQGWSPSGICTACGEGRRPVATRARTNGRRGLVSGAMFQPGQRTETADGKRHEYQTHVTVTGEACACPDTSAPTRPAVVLDPFGGTGTTALVASAYGRHGISVDMSADYCRLAAWRTTDPGQMAAARLAPKPPPEMPADMPTLFDDYENEGK